MVEELCLATVRANHTTAVSSSSLILQLIQQRVNFNSTIGDRVHCKLFVNLFYRGDGLSFQNITKERLSDSHSDITPCQQFKAQIQTVFKWSIKFQIINVKMRRKCSHFLHCSLFLHASFKCVCKPQGSTFHIYTSFPL